MFLKAMTVVNTDQKIPEEGAFEPTKFESTESNKDEENHETVNSATGA